MHNDQQSFCSREDDGGRASLSVQAGLQDDKAETLWQPHRARDVNCNVRKAEQTRFEGRRHRREGRATREWRTETDTLWWFPYRQMSVLKMENNIFSSVVGVQTKILVILVTTFKQKLPILNLVLTTNLFYCYNWIYRKCLSDYLVNDESQSSIRCTIFQFLPQQLPKNWAPLVLDPGLTAVSQRNEKAIGQCVRLGSDLTATTKTLTIPRFMEFHESWESSYVIKEICPNYTKHSDISTAPLPRVLQLPGLIGNSSTLHMLKK